MKTTPLRSAVGAALLLASSAGWANDFPTVDRVLYVQECVRNHPGPYYEMNNKCSCALDALARQVRFDDYLTMSTATLANSIGGERGGYIRDVESLQLQIRRLRDLQTKVKQGCFIDTASPR
jgi:hypothetical protein